MLTRSLRLRHSPLQLVTGYLPTRSHLSVLGLSFQKPLLQSLRTPEQHPGQKYTTHSYVKMASNPPGKCCYEGVLHEGKPSGEFSQLGDFEIYTKKPEGSYENGILMCVFLVS